MASAVEGGVRALYAVPSTLARVVSTGVLLGVTDLALVASVTVAPEPRRRQLTATEQTRVQLAECQRTEHT